MPNQNTFFNWTLYWVSIACLCASLPSQAAAKACSDQAKTELETAYCAIKAEGGGQSLPAFTSFRQNSEKIQYLLIKREATKLGITIAPPSASKQASTYDQPAPSSPRQTEPPKPSTPITAKPATPVSSSWRLSLDNCALVQESIQCDDGRQFLAAKNLPNAALAKTALTDNNTLVLPPRSRYAQKSDAVYLSQAYAVYLDKMLELGMGASTLSFSRFYSIYEDSLARQFSFTERFSSMYQYLKLDKQRNAIPARLSDTPPKNIHQCELLRHNLVVCDDGKVNWVFKAQTHYSSQSRK